MLAVLALFPLPVCSLDTCKKTSKKKANKKQRVKGAKEVTAQKNSLNVFCMATANTPQHAYTAICSSRFGQQSKQAGSSAVHQEDQSGEGRKKRKDRREGGRIIEVKRVVCVCVCPVQTTLIPLWAQRDGVWHRHHVCPQPPARKQLNRSFICCGFTLKFRPDSCNISY